MKKFVLFLVMIIRPMPAYTHTAHEAFHDLVCRNCEQHQCGIGNHPLATTRVGKSGPRGPVGPRGPPAVINMTDIERVMNTRLEEEFGKFEEIVNSKIAKAIAEFSGVISRRSCADVDMKSAITRNETGGVFQIFVPSDVGLTNVFCDMRTDGGRWIVFQRRMDGSVDFYRKWNDYENGFGELTGEFWLGLERIHQLTKDGATELRIDMIDKNTQTRYYAKYSTFKLSSSSDYYRLTLKGYSGNATDAMANPSGTNGGSGNDLHNRQFSTKDEDHDIWGNNCAITNGKGGWWYGGCSWSNLNGLYHATNYSGVTWRNIGNGQWGWMEYTEMKFRRRG